MNKREKEEVLTNFSQIMSSLVLVKFWREHKITLEDQVCETSESPPAHEQSINFG